MREYICVLGDGYSWRKVYYDANTGEFYCKHYHCGSVDISEEQFDGESIISKKDFFAALISAGRLNVLTKFYRAQRDGALILSILQSLERSSQIYNSAFQGDKQYTYYLFPNENYLVYFSGTYFSVDKKGNPTVSFAAVKDILDNSDEVKVSSYSYNDSHWILESLKA